MSKMAEAETGCSQAANNAAAASFSPVPSGDASQIQVRSVSARHTILGLQGERRLALLGSETAPFCSFFIQYGIKGSVFPEMESRSSS